MLNNIRIKKNFIDKSLIELFFILTLFIISFFSNMFLFIFLLSLLFLLKQKEVGALKILNIITFRSIINPGLAIEIGVAQNLKWLIIFACSFYLILSTSKINKNEFKKIEKILFLVALYFVFNIFVAFAYSSLPIVATFKLVSYVLVFAGSLIGIGYTYDKFNWIDWFIKSFHFIFIPSLFFINSPIGYLRNGRGFQGVLNHPNMFGVVSVLFIAILISKSQIEKKLSIYRLFLMIVVMYMLILSQSRTSLIAAILLLFMYTVIVLTKRLTYLKVTFFSFSLVILIFMRNKIFEFVIGFLGKGNDIQNILDSREGQVDRLMFSFDMNPLFGTGFSVPVLPFKSFSYSMEFIVEPGNLFLAVLGYSGILGSVLFLLYMLQILWSNRKNISSNIFLFISPIVISMGEMVFFSSNSIGIFCYMFLALYIFTEKDTAEVEKT